MHFCDLNVSLCICRVSEDSVLFVLRSPWKKEKEKKKMKSQMAWAAAVALLSVLFAYGLEASANDVDIQVRTIITAM